MTVDIVLSFELLKPPLPLLTIRSGALAFIFLADFEWRFFLRSFLHYAMFILVASPQLAPGRFLRKFRNVARQFCEGPSNADDSHWRGGIAAALVGDSFENAVQCYRNNNRAGIHAC